jgi:hypothetical protein
MLGIIQSQKWKICVPFCLCGLILPQQPDLFNHSPTAFSAVILGQATIDNVPTEEGDWVGVFDDSGNCAGAAEVELIDNRSVFILTIYGDDPATGETDEGLTDSEPFTLQIYDSSASVFLIHEGSYWGWQDTQGQFLDLFTPDSILNMVNTLKINQLQVIGSHNSYRMAPSDTLFMVLEFLAPDMVYAWDYTHMALDEQFLFYGIRQVELDVYHDPEGGLFSTRLGSYMIGDSIYAGVDELDEPGMKILHFPDIDFETHYFSFKSALEAIYAWSNTYPLHVPVFILVEAKSEGLEDYAEEYPELQSFLNNLPYPPASPLAFDLEALNALEQEIIDVFGDRMDKIITPDVVRENYGTLEEAVLDGAWPTLGESRGKIMFGLDNGGSLMEDYISGHPSLSGRILFVEANPGTPEAAFLGMNTPSDEITERVSEGYLVRTRSDTDTEQARTGDTSRRDVALESGAHFISTDYYRPDPRHESDTTWTDYSVRMPGDYFARVNPVSGPQDISYLEFDLVNFNMIFDFTSTMDNNDFELTFPVGIFLHQNFPNPFNPSTTFKYDLPIRSHVTLVIYDILGKEVTRLVNTTQDGGSKTISWNSTDIHGKPVSAGVYLYQIKTGEFSHTRKMILLK